MSRWSECYAKYSQRSVRRASVSCTPEKHADFGYTRLVSDDGTQPVRNSNLMREEEFFVKNPIPRPVFVDAASLVVDPEAVPSKAYVDTFKMLEMQLARFPNDDLKASSRQSARDVKPHYDARTRKSGSV
jgi:hypothetical protein